MAGLFGLMTLLLLCLLPITAALAQVSVPQKPSPPPAHGNPAVPGLTSPPKVPPQQAPASFTQYRHYDLSASDEWEASAYDADTCQSKCSGNQACSAYTFDAWNYKCFLKRDPGQLRLNPRATSGVISSKPQPPKSTATVTMKYYNNRAFPGASDASQPAADRDACERACWGSQTCIGFSFVKNDQRCDLFDNPKEYGKQPGVYSGAKEQAAN